MEAHAQRSMAAAERLRELTEARLNEEMGRLKERQQYEIQVRPMWWWWWVVGWSACARHALK